MIDIELNGSAPTHVKRIAPQFSVDENGKITWVPGLIDYDASLFYRGKTVTNDEFNTLFLRNVYQGNYITDSLSELFDEHLDTAIYRSFTSDFNLVPSYVKSFGTADWGTVHEDGYYYITIPASEHGFEPDNTETVLDKMNIDTEMYLLDEETGTFFEVSQVETDTDNTVTLYTDDNTLSGFVVIRTNDKAYALASATIDATQVTGLAKVATSAKYADLIDINSVTGPNTRIAANAANIAALMSDTEYTDYPFVHNADFATNATNADYATNLLGSGTIQNQPISSIFETGSSYVKNATNAVNVTNTINGNAITNIFENDGTTVKEATHADNATIAQYASSDTSKGTIEQRFNALEKTVKAYTINSLSELYSFVQTNINNIIHADIMLTRLIGVEDIPIVRIQNVQFSGGNIPSFTYPTGSESNWFGNRARLYFKYGTNTDSISGLALSEGGIFNFTLGTTAIYVNINNISYIADWSSMDLYAYSLTINSADFASGTVYCLV